MVGDEGVGATGELSGGRAAAGRQLEQLLAREGVEAEGKAAEAAKRAAGDKSAVVGPTMLSYADRVYAEAL